MNPDRDHRITPEHLTRDAVVYVRQSTVKQVQDNSESTRLQMGLREKAIALGWPDPTTVDDDLGVSAGGFAQRPGFRNLLARLAMREIGIILCIDASRLSRNSKDWAHLFELCSYFGTLIADTDQIYDLSHPNDRLVLGIKGTVTEMELGLIRARLLGGMQAKAQRGELRFRLPAGYVHDPDDRIVMDPDKRVRQAIRALFDRFNRCTSARQLAMWYRDTKTVFPSRPTSKDGSVRWKVPGSRSFYNILLHPIFAGAYVWGRRVTRVEYIDGELVKRRCAGRPVEDAQVCIRDHHPAYITWERYLANRSRLSQNRPRWKMDQNQGAIREGLALLAGILRCGRCGGRIYVQYRTTGALYYCDGGHEKTSRRCGSFGAKLIDLRVGDELMRACSPLGIEAALKASEERDRDRTEAIEGARLAVEAAQYAADRAFEQFDLCDPKNRLVAESLEQRLNAKLVDLQAAKERLAEISESEESLTETQRERLLQLAKDLPEVWNHSQADPKLKKRLLRAAIYEILVIPNRKESRLEVTIHWQGGMHTKTEVPLRARPKGGKADPDLVELVGELAGELSDAEIARILNMKEITTPRGLRWTQDRVSSFRKQRRIRSARKPRGPDVLTMTEAITHLGIGHNGIVTLAKRGIISANQITEYAPWKVSKAELDSEPVQAVLKTLKETGRVPRGGGPQDQPGLFDENKGPGQ